MKSTHTHTTVMIINNRIEYENCLTYSYGCVLHLVSVAFINIKDKPMWGILPLYEILKGVFRFQYQDLRNFSQTIGKLWKFSLVFPVFFVSRYTLYFTLSVVIAATTTTTTTTKSQQQSYKKNENVYFFFFAFVGSLFIFAREPKVCGIIDETVSGTCFVDAASTNTSHTYILFFLLF